MGYCLEIRGRRFGKNAFCQMSGKAVNDINLFRVFVELVDHVRQKTASSNQHTVCDVSSEFSFWLRETSGKFQTAETLSTKYIYHRAITICVKKHKVY